ncbi:hypothetical protein LBMAG46_06620 [Planctomycetia bacterium]|nr:hypothetical protein LBMAG46_06620 [Planctomycetia bacterium]
MQTQFRRQDSQGFTGIGEGGRGQQQGQQQCQTGGQAAEQHGESPREVRKRRWSADLASSATPAVNATVRLAIRIFSGDV